MGYMTAPSHDLHFSLLPRNYTVYSPQGGREYLALYLLIPHNVSLWQQLNVGVGMIAALAWGALECCCLARSL